MNIAELYDVFYAALEVLDRLFEFWLTGSFALLIATYFIGEKMNRTMYWLICIGYCLFSAGLAIRYIASTAKLVDMRTQLEAAGETLLFSNFSGFTVIITFMFGSIGTLVYLTQVNRNRSDT